MVFWGEGEGADTVCWVRERMRTRSGRGWTREGEDEGPADREIGGKKQRKRQEERREVGAGREGESRYQAVT